MDIIIIGFGLTNRLREMITKKRNAVMKYLILLIILFPSLVLAVDDATVQAIDSKASYAVDDAIVQAIGSKASNAVDDTTVKDKDSKASYTNVLIYFLVGSLIVLFFSINYFNQPGYSFVDKGKNSNDIQEDELLEPALPKYLTDRFEYNLYCASYVLVTEVVYVLLVLFLPDLVNNGNTKTYNNLIPTVDNIVLATLIITGIAPNLPYVSALLERSKLYLHEKAQIPKKGRAIYRQIKNNMPKYSSSVIEEILKNEKYLRDTDEGVTTRADLDAGDFMISSWTLEGRWAKLSYLLYFIDQWSIKIPFKSYIGNPELRFSSIEDRYFELQKLMAKHKDGKITDVDSFKLNTRLDATLNRTYRLLSCLLYLAAKTDSAVDRNLDELGYMSSKNNEFPIPWKTVVLILASVVGSIVVGSLLGTIIATLLFGVKALDQVVETPDIVSWTGYAIPFIIMPVLLVLFVKRFLSTRSESWPVVTEYDLYKSLGDRPWHIYFVVALFSYLTGVTVLYVMVIANSPKEIEYILSLRVVLAWSSVVFLTSGYTAFRLDSASNPNIEKYKYYIIRTAGALTQGILTAGLIYFVYMFNEDKPLGLVFKTPEEFGKMYVFCVIGFFLGISINLATGVGRLRQRRNKGRRFARRLLTLHFEGNSTEGETINISDQGALIVMKESLLKITETTNREELVVTVSNTSGITAKANVINVRGDRLQLLFQDIQKWISLQDKLDIAVHI